jgi:hypothetical protein
MNIKSNSEQEAILKAGAHTVFIETEIQRDDGSIDNMTGTGFFVSEKHILTAAHVVVPKDGTAIRIAVKCEGLKTVVPTAPTWDCELVAVMPTSDPGTYDPVEDLAILRCPAHHSSEFLRLSTEAPEVATVTAYVIGYPGDLDQGWLSSRHPDLKDPRSVLKEAKQMLPRRTLTVTEGKITELVGGRANYQISTVPGMSGGCLMQKGKVCGIFLVLFDADKIRSSSWT